MESRRPIHLDNIYNTDCIRVLAYTKETEDWQIPEAAQIYDPENSPTQSNDGEDDENEEVENEAENDKDQEKEMDENIDVDDSSRQSGRRKRKHEDIASAIERRAIKRQRHTAWRRNRGTLLWNYYMRSWYSTPVYFVDSFIQSIKVDRKLLP